MNLVITKWQPAQLTLPVLHDKSLHCVVDDVNLRHGKNNFIFITLIVTEGTFAGTSLYVNIKADIHLARTFFESVGISTAGGINVDNAFFKGKHVVVDVVCNSSNMMYDRISGFRPTGKTGMSQQERQEKA